MADWDVVLNAGLGLLQLALALLVVRHLVRFGRAFPWLAALMLYFALRGTARLYDAFATNGEEVFEVVTDAVLVVVVVLLMLGIERTVAGLKLALEAAQLREGEYQRALADYRALARHRLANPLTAILGGLRTLREMPDLPRETQVELLDGIEAAAAELERVSLDPVAESPEEQALNPRPEV